MGLGYCIMKQDYITHRIYKNLQYPVLGRSTPNQAGYFSFAISFISNSKGYFEISASFERSENNRVYFNIAAKFRASDSLNTRPVIARANSYAYTGLG